jgi:hypothetical protein
MIWNVTDEIYNEQLKLIASWLSNISVASIATGIIAASWAIGAEQRPNGQRVLIALMAWTIGCALQYFAQRALTALRIKKPA